MNPWVFRVATAVIFTGAIIIGVILFSSQKLKSDDVTPLPNPPSPNKSQHITISSNEVFARPGDSFVLKVSYLNVGENELANSKPHIECVDLKLEELVTSSKLESGKVHTAPIIGKVPMGSTPGQYLCSVSIFEHNQAVTTIQPLAITVTVVA